MPLVPSSGHSPYPGVVTEDDAFVERNQQGRGRGGAAMSVAVLSRQSDEVEQHWKYCRTSYVERGDVHWRRSGQPFDCGDARAAGRLDVQHPPSTECGDLGVCDVDDGDDSLVGNVSGVGAGAAYLGLTGHVVKAAALVRWGMGRGGNGGQRAVSDAGEQAPADADSDIFRGAGRGCDLWRERPGAGTAAAGVDGDAAAVLEPGDTADE